MKVLKAFVSIILTLLLFVFTTVLIGFCITKSSFQLQSIFYDTVHAEELNAETIANIDQITPELVHELVDQELVKRGIPTEALDYILESGDYVQIFEDFKEGCIAYISGNGEAPTLPMDQINQMIETGVQKYNTETGSDLKVEEIQEKVEEINEAVNEAVQEVGENKELKFAFQIIKSPIITIALIVSILIVLGLLILLNGILGSMIYCSVAGILSGISCLLLHGVMLDERMNKVKVLLGTHYTDLSDGFSKYGIIVCIGSALLFVLSIVLKVVNAQKTEVAE